MLQYFPLHPILPFFSAILEREESTISESSNFTNSEYNFFKRSKNYFFQKYFIDQPIQFNRSVLLWQIPTLHIKSIQHFPYSLKFHYSPVHLQKKNQYPRNTFRNSYIQNLLVSEKKALLFDFSKRNLRKTLFLSLERIKIFESKLCKP